MCVNSPCASEIADRISKDCAKIDSPHFPNKITGEKFENECVDKLVEAVVRHLDLSNEYYQRRMWNSLQCLAEAYPLAVSGYVSDILNHTSPNGNVQKLGSVLAPVLREGVGLDTYPGPPYLRALKEAGPRECRWVAVELHRRRGSRSDFKSLGEMADYETNELATRARQAQQELLTESVEKLASDESTDTLSETAFSHVVHASFNYPELLVNPVDELFGLLGTIDGDVAIVSLAELAADETISNGDLVDRLVDAVRIGAETSGQSADDVDESVYRRAEDSLETLIEAGHTDKVASSLVSRADEWLESDSVPLHEHALTQLQVLAERDPAHIEEHLDTVSSMAIGDDDRGSLAGEVLNRYGRARGDDTLSYVETQVGVHEEGSIVAHLAETVGCLQYRTQGQTEYQSVDIDSATDRALSNVADAAAAGQTLPVVWPKYEPKVVVLIALELALRQLDNGTDVVVFSPGGQSHWGNKGELRSEFANYGVTEADGSTVIPLPDLLPHARIDGGSVEPMSGGSAGVRVVFSKRVAEVGSLDSLDTLVANLTSRTKESYEQALDDVVDERDGVSVLPMYTNYTKHEFEERRAPRYGPPRDLAESDTLPGVDTLELTADDDMRTSEFPGAFASRFRQAIGDHDVRIVGVDDEGILQYLEPGYESSKELREYDENRAAGRIFSRQLMFERLPFPADRYDEWVRNQREGYFGPRTIDALIDKLEQRAEDVIGRPAIAGHLFDTADALRRARSQIAEQSPLYDELRDRLQASLDSGDRVAVFLPKATWCRAFETIAVEEGVVSEDDVTAGRVAFVSPDSARKLDSVDRLLMVGPQRPQYAGFYVTPGVSETVVLTYRGNWEWMIERDVERFVDYLNDSVDGVDYTPYSLPEFETELLVEPDVDEEKLDEASEPDTPRATSGDTDTGSTPGVQRPSSSADRDTLAELFDQSRPVDYDSGGSERYDDYERKEYELVAKDGRRLTRRDTVLRRRSSPSSDQGRYHWASPRTIKQGDEIAVFDEGVFEKRWDEWLTDTYEEEHGDMPVFEDLATWYDTLESILTEIARDLDVENLTHNSVRNSIRSDTYQIDREATTVWNWFESVAEADGPLNLAQDSSLTIGPRRAADIDELGESFERPEITGEDALRIEESMGRIRSTNMQQGHAFRNELAEKMNSLEDTELREKTTLHEIVSVSES